MSESDTLDLELRVDRGTFTLTLAERLPLRGITAVFGPSGGGKSTLLRAIAGLDRAEGHIQLADQCLLDSNRGIDVPAHDRPVGLAFQDGRLFPHLDVRGNLHFAWRQVPKHAREQNYFDEAIEAFELSGLLTRSVDGLSGGERQRVALARTLLARPQLLLLDEPLSALDATRKGDILPYLDELTARFSLPVLYVTHALDEVTRLADRVLVLDGGRQRLLGPVSEVLARADLEAITGRYDAGVLLLGEAGPYDEHHRLMSVQVDEHTLVIPTSAPVAAGQALRLRVLARDVSLALEPPPAISIRNVLRARVTRCQPAAPDSPFVEVSLALGQQQLRSRVTRSASEELSLREDLALYALIKSVSFDRPGD
ncbi:MAG: molybdenum ABC transporter ATP-binding protein [Pseudomonadota bacterium]